jgi:hypothetical protein
MPSMKPIKIDIGITIPNYWDQSVLNIEVGIQGTLLYCSSKSRKTLQVI